MKGRTEDKIKLEKAIQEKLDGYPNILKDYYYYLNEKTHNTKLIYINNVIRFLEYLSNNNINSVNNEMLSKINSTVIHRYMMDIQFYDNNKELKNSTKSNIYSAINNFLRFLKKLNIIDENPFDNKEIEFPKQQENEITYLEPEEYEMVKQAIKNGVGNDTARHKQLKWKYRDLLLFELPIKTGVRVTALTEINLEDIDFGSHTIRIIDKNKHHTLYLDEETFTLLLQWLDRRKRIMEYNEDHGYVFISNQKTKLTARSARRIVDKYTECLDKHITPHKLRSTCGTNMWRATHDIYLVADVLGHSSPATTSKYTKVGSKDRVNAAEAMRKYMNNF